MALKPISVTQLNNYISRIITTDPLLGNLSVVGEISNLKYHSSGHVYFSINDEDSKINCFLAASYVNKLDMALEDGLKVIINGYLNVYKKGGTYTLIVRDVQVEGQGDLSYQFQIMKDKLASEGLFDPKLKKQLPTFPKKIGIITSPTGAALQDMLKIITGRNDFVDVLIFPALVQGPEAAEDMAKTLDFINDNKEKFNLDCLIIGRGGGSQEDLWAFNEEILARAIFAAEIPIISAVGHEIDFSISDFVADKRAETPTAAAEMITPDMKLIKRKLQDFKDNLLIQLNNKVNHHKLMTDNILNQIKNSMDRRISQYEYEMSTCKLYLEENNPKNIMSKGYSILKDKTGKIIHSKNNLTVGEKYLLSMLDGDIIVKNEGENNEF